jgi:lipopolysaccharide transport protein LptA
VKAAELDYSDERKLAHYKGGATLTRPGVQVSAREIRAFLKTDEKGGSGLDHALADGTVVITRQAPGRTVEAKSDHAEYHLADERVLLEGGRPVIADSARGTTRGRKIVWYAKNDRLIVEGGEKQPVETLIRRK